MDKKLQVLYIREKELQEDEKNIQNLLQIVREEMHKMQVEQLQWESMGMPEADSVEENAASSSTQVMSDSEVNSQAVNLDVPKLNELFLHSNTIKRLDKDEQEEEEDESEDECDPEDENSDDDLLSFL